MSTVVWVVEGPPSTEIIRRALYSAVVTLTLGVLGSTILPVPWAFANLGILPGVAVMAMVAFVNDCTCCMLVRASAITGKFGYEQLAEHVGGHRAKVLAQVSLILLLYGTLCGGLAFLADVSRIMILKGAQPEAAWLDTAGTTGVAGMSDEGHFASAALGDSTATAGSWGEDLLALMRRDGRPVMLVVVATILYPLCLQRHIRQFERAATVGVVVVVVLMSLIISKAVSEGFPAIASGELPLWGFHKGGGAKLPEAFAVLGFAFYMQPMLMPLLAEMPHGESGRRVSETSVHIVLYGVACAAYGTVGVFGAALFGDATESNIMVNDLLPGRPMATLALYMSLVCYLCFGMVTTHYALRASIEVLLVGPGVPLDSIRRTITTTCILLMSLAVACTFPTAAEKIFAVTGCTAVCLVCYVLPVYIHLKLRSMQRQAQKAAEQTAYSRCSEPELFILPAPGAAGVSQQLHATTAHTPLARSQGFAEQPELLQPLLAEAVQEELGSSCSSWVSEQVDAWVLPMFIILVGVGCSVAGLYVGAMDILASW
eukprot:CAMPEP_0119116390 /NCGR_PEP_ID=MMETSP1180-20130426/52256_1 /TAXON_ID=3052 ORGANISM="Chlamydomonas cf sp, Strain CCMP681" /NCGR_SAMPLE_ID=MMETSP1180 /ASSEMBLY_ACC=CAM_ASM_000741 /LENGTH=542 /DNA_ID=CAMNT_0007105527 /DNA_START=42 /DNA_END=1667 /DNA_ORIENTATION=+